MPDCSSAAPCGDGGNQEGSVESVTLSDGGENPGGHSRQNSEDRKTWPEKKATLKGHWKAPALGEHSCWGVEKEAE